MLLGNEILDELPRRQSLGKQSVAKLRNNRTAVLRNPFLGNGSVNTLPQTTIRIWEDVFSLWSVPRGYLEDHWATQAVSGWQFPSEYQTQLVVGGFQVNTT
jgi:hypothetical protein